MALLNIKQRKGFTLIKYTRNKITFQNILGIYTIGNMYIKVNDFGIIGTVTVFPSWLPMKG